MHETVKSDRNQEKKQISAAQFVQDFRKGEKWFLVSDVLNSERSENVARMMTMILQGMIDA